MHCRYDSSHTPSMHTDTLHTRGCALGRYKHWHQCWLWIVIPASVSMVTAKKHKHKAANGQTDGYGENIASLVEINIINILTGY